jgi:hypothetical protein
MTEKAHYMKNCPSCHREIPTIWEVCYFCGNVFKKSESKAEMPSMLFWNIEKLEKSKTTLHMTPKTIQKSRGIRSRKTDRR